LPEASGPREWSPFLKDMQQLCAKVMRYTDGLSQDQFFSNELIFDAVLRNIELLGEAAKQIPIKVQQRHPVVPWRRIAGLRDIHARAYSASRRIRFGKPYPTASLASLSSSMLLSPASFLPRELGRGGALRL